MKRKFQGKPCRGTGSIWPERSEASSSAPPPPAPTPPKRKEVRAGWEGMIFTQDFKKHKTDIVGGWKNMPCSE